MHPHEELARREIELIQAGDDVGLSLPLTTMPGSAPFHSETLPPLGRPDSPGGGWGDPVGEGLNLEVTGFGDCERG